MFAVIELVEDNSIAVVHNSWLVSQTEAYWPMIVSSKTEKLMERGMPPPPNFSVHKARLHRIVGTFTFHYA